MMTELEGQFSLLIAISNTTKNGAQISETGNFFSTLLRIIEKVHAVCTVDYNTTPIQKKLVTEIEMRLFSRNIRGPIITCKQFTKWSQLHIFNSVFEATDCEQYLFFLIVSC